MSDNIYRVLMGDNAPFSGMANISYYDRVLKGRIVKVHYDVLTPGQKEVVINQQSYRTVDVEWLEGKPFTSMNVHIPELVSFLGYGLNYLPAVNDIVLAGFDSNDSPQILTIVARCSAYEHGAIGNSKEYQVRINQYGDPEIDTTLPDSYRPTPIRKIKQGEISLTSVNNNSELYFDKYGTAKLISRIPVLTETGTETTGKTYINGLQCGNRLWEFSLGQDIVDESPTASKEPKKSSFGNNVQLQVLGHQNGCRVDFDSKGNIEVINNGNTMTMDVDGNFEVITSTGNSISLTNGKIKISDNQGNSIEMSGSNIKLGDNANFSAVLGESLNTLLASMIAIFNSHTHMYAPGPGTPTPTAITETPMVISDILSKTIKIKQ